MNETANKIVDTQKLLKLARSSRQQIERLWQIKIDISHFSNFIAPLFSSILNTLVKATTQVVSYNRTIRELYLNRIEFIPPLDLVFRDDTPFDEELAPIEVGSANVSFLFNVNVARKTARKFAETVSVKTPKPALNLIPSLFEAEVSKEGEEEQVKTVPSIFVGLQRAVASKVAPSVQGIISTVAPLVVEVVEEDVEKPPRSAYPGVAAVTRVVAVPRAVAGLQRAVASKVAPSVQGIISTVAPLVVEVVEEDVEKPPRSAYPGVAAVTRVVAVPRAVAGLQRAVASKVAPSVQGIISTVAPLVVEVVEEDVEKPPRSAYPGVAAVTRVVAVPRAVAGLQRAVASKVAPSVQGIISTVAPLVVEVVEEDVEKPPRSAYPGVAAVTRVVAVPRAVAGLQRAVASKVAPSVQGIISTVAPLVVEVVEEDVEKPPRSAYPGVAAVTRVVAVPRAVAGLQRAVASKVAPSVQGIISTVAPLVVEVVEEDVEKPPRSAYPGVAAVTRVVAVPRAVAGLQRAVASKVAPSIRVTTSALTSTPNLYKEIIPTLLAISKPVVTVPARFESLPIHPLVTSQEKAAPHISLPERSLSEIPPVSSYPQEEMKISFLNLVSVPDVTFGAEAVKSYRYATILPKILVEGKIPTHTRLLAFPNVDAPHVGSVETPVSMLGERFRPAVVDSLESVAKLPSSIFDQKIPIVKPSIALSMLSTPKESIPSIEPTAGYSRTDRFPAKCPSATGGSLKEISPFLASWIYNISKILQDTTASVSAVPNAASIVDNVVTRILLQPISSVEVPWISTTNEPSLVPSGLEMIEKPPMIEAFRLPQIVASLVVEQGRKFNLLSGVPEISESLLSTVELGKVAPEENMAVDTIPEMKIISKLPILVALASTASLIAYKLQQESTILMTGMQAGRLLPEGTLSELATMSPAKTTMVKRIAAASRLSPHRSKPTRWVPLTPRQPAKIRRVSPTVQNEVNITVAAESKDEDLRDLERKISRILSEQIRRYYGSTRF